MPPCGTIRTLKESFDKRFVADSLANLLSLGVMGVAGLAFNSLIPRFYGSGGLGTFNEALAIVIVLGQMGTFGVQMSVLRHLPEHAPNASELRAIIWSALRVTVPAAIGIGIFLAAGARAFAWLMHDEGLVLALSIAAPATALFSCNKVLLNVLNALQRNQLYALFVAGRYGLMVAFLLALVAVRAPAETLTALLLGAEAVLTVLLLLRLRPLLDRSADRAKLSAWSREHRRFGLRAVGGGLAIDLNTRLDVLMVGAFFDNRVVGIYSLAAFFCEMLLQLPTALRRVIDPILAVRLAAGDERGVRDFVVRGVGLGIVVAPLIAIVAALLFHTVVRILTGSDAYAEGFQPFLILLVGAVVYGAFYPFFGLLGQAGHPGLQTALTVVVLVANVGCNLVLIPWLGLDGAAASASIALLCGVAYFCLLARRHVFRPGERLVTREPATAKLEN